MTSPSSSRGVIDTVRPTFVSRRNVRTASVALSSPNIARVEGALGCFYPQDFPISFLILCL